MDPVRKWLRKSSLSAVASDVGGIDSIAFAPNTTSRPAIGLGIIGGGGFGLELYIRRHTTHYTNMMACTIPIFLLSGTVEFLSQRVRSDLRDEDEVKKTSILGTFLTATGKSITPTSGRQGQERP